MAETNQTATSIEVMWRPGCPFCRSLRRGLSRAGVATTEHDIWSSEGAAARVRQATGGDETVPTVFVGDRALVNPSVRQVVDAIKAVDPDHEPVSTSATDRRHEPGTRRSLGVGLIWTLVVAVVWSGLVAWRPTTTWHLAPLVLAAAWPWVVGQDTTSGDPSARRRILLAGSGGLGAALALTGVLAAAGRLDGPTWTGSGNAVVEALLLSVGGAVIATTMGLLLTARRTSSACPWSTPSRQVETDLDPQDPPPRPGDPPCCPTTSRPSSMPRSPRTGPTSPTSGRSSSTAP